MPLIGTLTSGVSALKAFTKDLEVIGNNIANVNTTAFKASKTGFENDFSNTLRASSTGVDALQVGTGVKLGSINTNFSQGALSTTGVGTDLGVSGNGFFRVVSTDAAATKYVTRSGNFHWDSAGYLVTSNGMQVQGFTGTGAATPTTTLGSIQLTTPSGKTRESVSIGRDGVVTETYSDGTTGVAGQILLQDFKQPSALMSQGDGLFTGMEFAGPVTGTTTSFATDGTSNPNSNGLGTIEAGTLELSNVDLTEQFSNMITSQRSFQASSRLVTVSDQILEEIVNLKR